MDALLLALQNVSSQLLPIVGVVALILLCILFSKLSKFVESLTGTVKGLGGTIKLVDTSMEKVQAPLDTAVKLSHTIDDVHDSSVEAVKKAGTYINDNVDSIKSYVSDHITKKSEIIDTEDK